MPVNYCQLFGLCRSAKEIVKDTSEKVNKITKRYGIFLVLILEIISIFVALKLGKNFVDFWYGFLANNVIFILLYKNYCDRKTLKYCQRTVIGLKALLLFYSLNIFVMITHLGKNIYYASTVVILLGTALIALLISIFIKKK